MSAVDRTSIRACVIRVIAESAQRSGMETVQIGDDTDLLGSGLIDSLALVDLLIAVEAEFGMTLALERLDFEVLDSLGSLVDQLHLLQNPVGQGRGSAVP